MLKPIGIINNSDKKTDLVERLKLLAKWDFEISYRFQFTGDLLYQCRHYGRP